MDFRQRRPWPNTSPPFDQRTTADLLETAVFVLAEGGIMTSFLVVTELAERVDEVAVESTRRLLKLIDELWARGWQPVEVVHHVRRGCPKAAVRLVLAAIAADRRGRDPDTLDPRWIAQIDGLGVELDSPDPRWPAAWIASRPSPRDAVVAIVELLARLSTAPTLEALIPPPGAGPGWTVTVGASWGDVGAAAEADPVLERVRALLAKAESTTFEAEADAFTAKAQELIARHAIDAAVLAEGGSGDDRPAAIRVCIDDPYVDAKTLLLQVVADAGRCRAAHHSVLALSTVVGFPGDLAAVELLFTSLLVQAQASLAAAARAAPPGARTRSRGYRSTFLLSYATRIGQRLEEINRIVVAETEAEHGRSLVPVLASRQAEVDDALDDLFGSLTTHTIRGGYDPAGWAGGQLAADAADLGRPHLRGSDR